MFKEKIAVKTINISNLLGKVRIQTHDAEEIMITSTEEDQVSIEQNLANLLIQTKMDENSKEKPANKGIFNTVSNVIINRTGNKQTIINHGKNQTIIIGHHNVVSKGSIIQNGQVTELATVDMTILVPKDLITSIDVAGHIHVDIDSISEELEIDNSGQTSIAVSHVKKIELDTSGQSRATIEGVAHLKADISGQSNVEIKADTMTKLKVELSGQSTMRVHANSIDKVKGDVSGMSHLSVTGTVLKKDVDTSGMSKAHFR